MWRGILFSKFQMIYNIDKEFCKEFNQALLSGISNIDAVVEKYGKDGIIKGKELKEYLTHNIDYDFNEDKKKALNLFLEFLKKL